MVVGEDADDVGSPPDFAIDALQRVGAAEFRPVRGREAVEGEQVFLGSFEQLGDLRQRRLEALEYLTEPRLGCL